MSTYDDCRSGSVDIKKKTHYVLGCLRVKVTRRLIGDKDLGVIEHSTRDRDSLTLTARELLRICIRLILKSYDIKNQLYFLMKTPSGQTDDLSCK